MWRGDRVCGLSTHRGLQLFLPELFFKLFLEVQTLTLYVVAMSEREIVMGLFVCQTLSLFFEKLP